MNILLSNDDGIHADGLRIMRDALERHAGWRIITVAPASEQSAAGHAVTLGNPLRLSQVGDRSYKVNGTPADCVLLGMKVLFKRKPDLVISGINRGQNLGEDVYYSGTVAAAREGAINGVRAMAVSVAGAAGHGFGAAARFAAGMAGRLGKNGLEKGMFLNINVPDTEKGGAHGALLTRPGSRTYRNVIQPKTDPRGGTYYWVAGTPVWKREHGTDYAAVSAGRISVTPMGVAPDALAGNNELKKILNDKTIY